MFIKVSDNPERYVNTDLIEVVSFGSRQRQGGQQVRGCTIDFRSGRALPVSEDAGRVLIEFAEANSAFSEYEPAGTSPPTPGAVPAAPLQSRIAQHLRDSAPNGAAIMDLVMQFPNNDTGLMSALDELKLERVVVLIPGNGVDTIDRYYHASNAPRQTPNEAVTGDNF